MKEKITIITPTFNRVNTLHKLYESLVSQKDKRFIWLVIDDGSKDGTSDFLNSLSEKDFDIKYIKKENGGKHTALNLAFENLTTELACIVDSDDYLKETAVFEILNDWEKYKNNKSICGLCYLKQYNNDEVVSALFPFQEKIANYNEYIINGNIIGDKFEVFRSEILKNNKFPVFEGEKFIGEGVIWSIISHSYDMVFFNKALYICEYLTDGLTNSGRKMRLKNPRGGAFHAKEYLDRRYSLKIREKNALLYLVYIRLSGEKVIRTILSSNNKLLLMFNYIPSYILYLYWKHKHMR